VVIKTSSSKQIDALVAGLSGESLVTREAAVARLTVIGARAVERLVALVESDAAPAARTAALRTLEAIADLRALDAALRAIRDADEAVATAAIGVARSFLRGRRGAAALDRLAEVALDKTRDEQLRLAAIRALADLPASTVKPLWQALGDDANAAIRAQVESGSGGSGGSGTTHLTHQAHLTYLTAAAERGLDDDPGALRQAIVRGGARIPLQVVHRIIERVREREASEPAGRRPEWLRARAAAHVVLANRGSRLALYDLCESLKADAAPLPVEFLTALSLVGDPSCLEAIAAAHQRSDDDWWRLRLSDSFRSIVERERITRRHAVMKRIQKRWGNAAKELIASRSRASGSGESG
jgi:HEAT repeat protein